MGRDDGSRVPDGGHPARLNVVGAARWNPEAAGYAPLAERVARARPTAVFVGGLLDTNGARVVRDLRARLGRSAAILVPDTFAPLPLFVEQAGSAAIGTYASYSGVLTDGLPPAGKRFVERFAATQAGVAIEPSAVYAAQTTEVLLDAIARSDGSRSSVTDELFATRVEDGLLGTFGFDANGDITESPVTILRVTRGGSSREVRSVEGGEVERVVRPAASSCRRALDGQGRMSRGRALGRRQELIGAGTAVLNGAKNPFGLSRQNQTCRS